jgi:hypothetical protein
VICPVGKISGINVQPQLQKYFSSHPTQITGLFIAVSSLTKGALAIVTNVGVGCGGRGCAFDEQRATRTAKACGPDAPMLASSFWEAGFPGATVTKEPGHRGEHAVNRNTIARGKPDDPVEPVVSNSCAFFTAQEAAGAIGTRFSPLPSLKKGRTFG